jgi:hypothetical protein
MKITWKNYAKKSFVAVVCFVLQLSGLTSLNAAPTYTEEFSIATSGYGAMVRAGGYIFVKESTTSIKQINESTGALVRTIRSTVFSKNFSDTMTYAAPNVVGFHSDGTMFKISADSSGTYINVPFQPCGTNVSALSEMVADDNYVLVACSSFSQANAKTLHLYEHDFNELASATVTWAPGKAALANGFAYIANLDSPYDMKKISLSAFNAAPYTDTTNRALAITQTSLATANDLGSIPSRLRVTSDSQYVWAISGSNNVGYKLNRISIADNSITTITLSSYVAGAAIPNYGMGNISSDGTTLYISFYVTVAVVGVNIADSSVSLLANTSQTTIWGIQAAPNAFWVSGNNAALKYSYRAATSSDDSAENRRKRQAAIDAARYALVLKIKAGETVINSDFISADMTQFSSDLATRVNSDFQVAAKAKDFGYFNVSSIVKKWSLYQDIQNGVRANVTGRSVLSAGIIRDSVKFKQLLANQLMNTDPSERATVEKIDSLIASLTKKQAEQHNRKTVILDKASGNR